VIDVLRSKSIEQGVALTGRNLTGPPCSVGSLTAHVAGLAAAAADSPRARRPPARPPTVLQTTTIDKRQTPASKTILAH